MDRWNELIAGFVLGNLTPEEAESVAQILAENPQLAVNIARLRNTATVRSMRSAEWSTARSQDGSEGWADTALDLPDLRAPSGLIDSRLLAPAIEQDQLPSRRITDNAATSQAHPPCHVAFRQRCQRWWDFSLGRYQHSSKRRERKVDIVESLSAPLLSPLFNPLWWMAIAAVVVVSVDDFRVRRSLSAAQAEIAQLKALESLENDE